MVHFVFFFFFCGELDFRSLRESGQASWLKERIQRFVQITTKEILTLIVRVEPTILRVSQLFINRPNFHRWYD